MEYKQVNLNMPVQLVKTIDEIVVEHNSKSFKKISRTDWLIEAAREKLES